MAFAEPATDSAVKSNFSTSANTSLSASKPMSMGMNSKPSNRFTFPNVNLLTPRTGSIPIVQIRRPRTADIALFRAFCPPMLAIVDRPNTDREKYSAGQNFSATLARGPENRISTMIPTAPPTKDATSDTPSASPALPFLASGYPSNAVTTADGVPGVFMVTAVIEPP
ncbi:MAG: hypothetical protein BWY92_01184 [Firmicutes bacterium ADurb.BinA052]|nr:MAG: hypothetical protein BWY92_01184 [Firmicutes bacterium ADurb.BinA052]